MSSDEPVTATAPTGRRILIGVVAPIVVLVGALGVARALVKTGPDAKRRPQEHRARLVEVVAVTRGPAEVVVPAMGTVRPAHEIVLAPEVGGRVIEVSPELRPGGRFARGAMVLRIDPRDAELALRQRESELARAEADLELEQGNQAVARREVEMLGEELSDEEGALALRAPQLATARAQVEAARAARDMARLDLERSTVRAPFDAVVMTRSADLGARVAPGTALATLVGSEAYWIEALVPVEDLRWISIPGSSARVLAGDEGSDALGHPGLVVALDHEVDPAGRMARLLVEVANPLGDPAPDGDAAPAVPARPPLLIGSYVRLAIEGHTLDDVVDLDRAWLHDGDRVWVMDDADALDVRPVTVAFRGATHVLVSDGLADGARVVISPLAAPVDGMPLRLADETRP